MNAETPGLFRREVVERRSRRLQGEVSLAIPLSWQLIGWSLFAALTAALAFLGTARHARTEVVPGSITLDAGVVPVSPARSGRVTAIAVAEGQQVQAGQELAQVGSDETLADGRAAPGGSLTAVRAQAARLTEQAAGISQAAVADRARLTARLASLEREQASLAGQIAAQQRLVQLADADFNQVRSIAGRGFVSRRDIDQRETTLITREQQLAELRQAQSVKRGDMEEARSAIAQSEATAAAQGAAVLAGRAQLDRSVEELEQRAGYRLNAPIGGMVTSLTARVGQTVGDGTPLLVILPEGARFTAELEVPSAAAGFLEIGQEVKLAVDSYPYQQFGLLQGRIDQLPRAVISRPSGDGKMKTFYPVRVTIARPFVRAYGRSWSLNPGMVVAARIVIRRQSLLETLFAPLLSGAQR